MGLSYDQSVQERIAQALERIVVLLTPAAPADAPEAPQIIPKRRGRPPKVRNVEDDRT